MPKILGSPATTSVPPDPQPRFGPAQTRVRRGSAVGGLLVDQRLLIILLCIVTLLVLRPGAPVPAIRAPGARVALETARFLVTFATAGLLTGFSGGLDASLRRGFIAALVVLGLTDLWFGVIPNMAGTDIMAGTQTLLPWIAARYIAGVLFVLAGLGWPQWSTGRLLGVVIAVYAAIEGLVLWFGSQTLPVTLDADGLIQTTPELVALELVPMVLFGAGAVLASRLYQRDQQPLEGWLAAALTAGVFTQIHEAAFPAGLGPVVSSADLLRALSTVLLLIGAIQQVMRLKRDRIRALELSQADLRELRDTSNRLQDYVAQEASFRSVVTHELSTPVATIAAYAHVLRSLALPDQAREAVTTIGEESSRLRSLITRMDELSDIDTDALSVQVRPVAVRPLLEEAAAFGRASPGAHPVGVTADVALLDLDPTRMSQVLRNLVGNAVRYSPTATAISLTGRLLDDHYVIEVCDDGPGFGVRDHDALFAKYQRGPMAAVHEGTGLGLWIVREIVTAHGGTVDIIQPEEPGARVQVRLPVQGAGA